MQKVEFRELLEGYLSNTLTDQQLNDFLKAVSEKQNQQLLEERIQSLLEDGSISEFSIKERGDVIFDIVMQAAGKKSDEGLVRRGKFTWVRFAAAAVFILAICLAGYYFLNNSRDTEQMVQSLEPQEKRFKNDILPSSDETILELSDGRKVILDNTQGMITKVGGTTVINLEGQLNYQYSKSKDAEVVYHTIHTGKGDQYALVLPDGSKVWLNALSSLRFPVAFLGNERRVSVTGEAHFEIAHLASKPFKVDISSGSQGLARRTVEVLGTSFNINAYEDEASIRTTLLEGAVKVAENEKIMTINPGRQVKMEKGELILVNNPDLEETMAWKNGRFHFENADIRTIMRNIGRWYDVDVEYKAEISDLFVARIPRGVPLSKLLKYLELTELVHFRIEGRKITVLK
jgi:transmembrane sensor